MTFVSEFQFEMWAAKNERRNHGKKTIAVSPWKIFMMNERWLWWKRKPWVSSWNFQHSFSFLSECQESPPYIFSLAFSQRLWLISQTHSKSSDWIVIRIKSYLTSAISLCNWVETASMFAVISIEMPSLSSCF